ncbi:hypothetical protein [Kangiella sediminilitoris]|uniref:Uncharacterized protein n=1 Tax=Kangiella sediminilitoris TaxID=1144748 RepID=A0A1B3B8S8_9GAMM|nr:hypothetical protein [Kangiella sediminilitoris]AOE49185.1 hypothetical protein KS2013_461 [Kangiella sediminilitoris]
MENLTSDNTITLVLGVIALVLLLAAVVMATLKHALVRQLESKNDELKNIIKENTQNIAKKKGKIEELESDYRKLQDSLTSLSDRNTSLVREHRELNSKYQETLDSYEEAHKNYMDALQTITNLKQEYESEIYELKEQQREKIKYVRQEAKDEIEEFKENYLSDYEHIKKSHKRLISANQTLSKNTDNLRDERDFYRTEFETLRDFLHDSQMKNVKDILKAKEKELEDKVVKFENKTR